MALDPKCWVVQLRKFIAENTTKGIFNNVTLPYRGIFFFSFFLLPANLVVRVFKKSKLFLYFQHWSICSSQGFVFISVYVVPKVSVSSSRTFGLLQAVLWIRDIWVRIRILLVLSVAVKMPTKNVFFFNFACLILYKGTFTLVFIDKKSKDVTK